MSEKNPPPAISIDVTKDLDEVAKQIESIAARFDNEISLVKMRLQKIREKVARGPAVTRPSKLVSIDQRVEGLRKEVLESLDRLENMDIEGE